MSMRSDGNSDGYEPVFQGRYGDGVSAETVDADVRLTETGIEITRRAPDEVLFWPYAGLAAAVPLGPHAIDVLLRYRYVPGATLFVAEGAFARRLQEHAPHLTARAVRRAHAAPAPSRQYRHAADAFIRRQARDTDDCAGCVLRDEPIALRVPRFPFHCLGHGLLFDEDPAPHAGNARFIPRPIGLADSEGIGFGHRKA